MPDLVHRSFSTGVFVEREAEYHHEGGWKHFTNPAEFPALDSQAWHEVCALLKDGRRQNENPVPFFLIHGVLAFSSTEDSGREMMVE